MAETKKWVPKKYGEKGYWQDTWGGSPKGWAGRQLSKFLTADEVANDAHNYLSQYYTGTSLPLGAITLGKKKASSASGLLSYASDDHLLTIAPSRAGKGTCQIVPTLLTYKGSTLVIDIKGENHAITARHRAKISAGAKVFKFAPFENDTCHFNPLDFIEPSEDGFSTASFLAEMMIPASKFDESFWVTEARNLLAIILLFVRTSGDDETMHKVVVMANNTNGLDDTLDAIINGSKIPTLRMLAGTFLTYDDKVKMSVLAQMNSALRPWLDLKIQNATAKSDFSISDLRHSMFEPDAENQNPISIYLCLPPEKLRSYRSVLRVIVGIAIYGMTRKLPTRTDQKKWLPKPANPVLFMLDELPALGYMSPVLDGLGYLAGYGGQMWVFAQAIGQLKAIYGESWQVFMSSAGAFSAFSINDLETSEYISRLLGKTDEYLEYYHVSELYTEYSKVEIPPPMDWVNTQHQLAREEAGRLEKKGWELDDYRSNSKQWVYSKELEKEKRQNRWTQDEVGPPNYIRQLGDRFMIVFLKGVSHRDGLKPALVRKVPYYSVDKLNDNAGYWIP
ncbi:MAG: type IV secretory system conjugative DNA transfer family protein [Mariprofundaceae bacterium]|nr:type IV secretory system conjugative DNA transfer family protein [Mariprofundaceae bacterium]